MFAKSRKEKFVGQAHGLARDLSEAITPHVERARDEIGPRLADARDQVAPRLADARDQVAPRLADARDQIAPRLTEARDDLAPRLADARKQIAPHLEDARGRLAKGVAAATAAAAPVAAEAQRRGELATAALKGEPVKRKKGKKKFLLFAGLLGLGALAAQKLRGGEKANWQTSYSPTPAPTPAPSPTPAAAAPAPPAPPSPAAPMSGSHAADVPSDAETVVEPVGANPGESISDAVEEPHPVTTPDAPAETVEVSEDPEKG